MRRDYRLPAIAALSWVAILIAIASPLVAIATWAGLAVVIGVRRGLWGQSPAPSQHRGVVVAITAGDFRHLCSPRIALTGGASRCR